MNVYNLKRDDIFKVNGNSTRDIDFYSPLNEYGIYDMNNYENDRPILKKYSDDYNIIQTKDDYNREILLQHDREQNEIVKNMGEISITRDPRITKYEDTYSITPYATFMITPLSKMDGEDIVSRFDHCYGEWENVDRCNINKPCKRIENEFIIHNPDYTGEHCRDEEGRRLRDGDTKMVYCNDNKCNGHGKCNGYDVCSCDPGYSGPNCDNTCQNTNCKNGVAIPPDCKCECKEGWQGDNCDVCSLTDDCNNGIINLNTCKCKCNNGYTGPNCETKEVCKPENLSQCMNGDVTGFISDGCKCECKEGWQGDNCDKYNCIKLKKELIDFDTNFPNALTYDLNNSNNGININKIQNMDEITGIFINISPSNEIFLNYIINALNYIIRNTILEKIFECYNINYINLGGLDYYKKLDNITISIFDILKKYNKLNYVKYALNGFPSNNQTMVNFLVTISKKYYTDMPYRTLKMTDYGYFALNKLPYVFFVSGIGGDYLSNNCKLKKHLHSDYGYNRYIPFEYFKEC
jgi:hypothetical protein